MTIESILKWFRVAKPEPTTRDIATQIGCHFEEVSEMMNAMGFIEIGERVNAFASEWKKGEYDCVINGMSKHRKIKLLDALCDQVVTAAGVAEFMGMDFEGGLNEVNASNWSKFNEDGRPDLDENGKIKKGPHCFKPNLEKFV